MSDELRGAYACPICGWPLPHSHTQAEIAERPAIDGARTAFEKEAREFMAGPYFKGPRTGYWWAYEAELARRSDPPPPPFDATRLDNGWAARDYPQGRYREEFVEVMWQFWRMAWLSARAALSPTPQSQEAEPTDHGLCPTLAEALQEMVARAITAGHVTADGNRVALSIDSLEQLGLVSEPTDAAAQPIAEAARG